MPPVPALQQAEFQVALVTGSGQPAAPPQTLTISIRPTQPTAVPTEDVDQLPAVTTGTQRPDDYLLAIGLSSYREQDIAARKYASLDAETVAAYFQTLSGLPQNNVRLLRNGAPSGPTSKKRCSIGFQPRPLRTRWSSSILPDRRW